MRGYPQFSFWISIVLVKIYISCIIINRGKNTFELVGTVLKTAAATKASHWNRALRQVNCFAIIPRWSRCTKWTRCTFASLAKMVEREWKIYRCGLALSSEQQLWGFTSSFGRLRQKIAPKSVQRDYFTSFNQSNHSFVALSLPSSFVKLPSFFVDYRKKIV